MSDGGGGDWPTDDAGWDARVGELRDGDLRGLALDFCHGRLGWMRPRLLTETLAAEVLRLRAEVGRLVVEVRLLKAEIAGLKGVSETRGATS